MAAVRKPRSTAPRSAGTSADADGSAPAEAQAAAPGRSDFLGVSCSVRGFAWRDRLPLARANIAAAVSQRHGMPELLGRMLAARDVGLDDVATFLEPSLRTMMPDPASLQGMAAATARLADAIETGTRIAIFGDYDVDGASSAALLARFLTHHGIASRLYIPDRIFEGYGPNTAAIETLVKEGAGLIVTVDCGTTSFEPLAVARRHTVDVLVIDHHQADAELPDVAAVVNPNRQDDISGLGHLCAAGVVFLVLVSTVRELRRRGHYGAALAEPDLLQLLDIVALATVADVVPLRTLNRAYVTQGLKVMRQRRNIGLKALFDAAGLATPPTPYTLGFVLGPRINAGGRIGDAALGARLLATEDEMEAARIAVQLDKLNRERKAVEKTMLEQAVAEAERRIDEDPELPILLLGSSEWHKGVVGLVASRLTERFGRPACVLSWEAGEEGTGSLRSLAGVDIGAAVRGAVAAGLLVKGGGHPMAAGLTVRRDKLPELEAYLVRQLSPATARARQAACLEIDGALRPAAVDDRLLDLIDRVGPFGQGNPSPRFAFPFHRIRFAKLVGEAHVRCSIEAEDGSRMDAVAFRAAGQPVGLALLDAMAGGTPVHLAGSVRRDTWNGREKIELTIDDVALPESGRRAGG